MSLASDDAASRTEPKRPRAERPGAARVGQVVATRWHLDALLGQGGMAAVYAATDLAGRRAALKILHADLAEDPDARRRFLREAVIASRVEHPCAVAVLDQGSADEGTPFLVLELLDGRSLERAAKRAKGRLPPPLVLRIMERVLDLLASCHAQGITHRDLKPANILVTAGGEVKVLDFGVARTADPSEEILRPGMAIGTPHFMAPEQAMGAWAEVDARADVFSVGATIFALVSGTRLNQGATLQESFGLASSRAAPSLVEVAPEAPSALVRLVDRALAWDKRARFQNAAAMREELVEVLGAVDDGTSTLEPVVPHARARPSAAPPAPDAQRPRRSRSSRPPPPSHRPSEPVPRSRRSTPPPPPAELAHESCSRATHALAEAFLRTEELVAVAVARGLGHPDAEARLASAHDAFQRALGIAGGPVELSVFPYSIAAFGSTVWEPAPPADVLAWGLFAAGVRALWLEPGLSAGEIATLVRDRALATDDPSRAEVPPVELTGRLSPGLRVACADPFAIGSASERDRFLADCAELEASVELALRPLADRAMLARPARRWSSPPPAATLEAALLDERRREAMREACARPDAEWTARCASALAEAYAYAAELEPEDAEAFSPLRAWVADRTGARGFLPAISLHVKLREALGERLGAGGARDRVLARAMLEPHELRTLLGEASRLCADLDAGRRAAPEVTAPLVARWVRELLAPLGPDLLPSVLAALPGVADPGVAEALVDFIGRHGVGREIRVALELPRLGADLVHRVLSVLAKPENPNARGLVLSLATGQFPVVRLVAAAHLGELDGALAGEVVVALGSEDADTRVAAMRAAARHHIPGATSLVARMGEPGVLHELPRREREVVLETLHELDGARAEALAIELAGRHGLISDTRLSELRLTAVELLGRHARSPEALAALRSASAPLWWNSSEVRAAALEAYSRVEERLRCNTRGTAPAEAR